MMSNSRLDEQIHGMMRHSLRSQVGMDQADHQRQYMAKEEFEMRRQRRTLGDGDNRSKDERKQAKKHNKTKSRLLFMSEQLLERAGTTVKRVKEELLPSEVPTPSEMKSCGRRSGDKKNVEEQIAHEDERASRLRRERMTPDSVKTIALNTVPTNDASF